MKTSFIKEGAVELNGRFNGTFISLRKDGVALPIYVRSIPDTDKAKGTITISGTIVNPTTKDWVPLVQKIKEDSLDYFPPKPGLRNMSNYALYYDIVPVRHRYRGLRREQIRLGNFDSSKAEHNVIDSGEFQYNIFNPEYLSVEAAIELVNKKKRSSVAFSPTFAVYRSKAYKHLTFVYKKKIAGLYSKNDRAVILPSDAHHLADELSLYITCVKDNT